MGRVPKLGAVERAAALSALNQEVVACRACPRLVEWRERVATEKRAAFAHENYWGRPLPGFGDPSARMLIVGLAPAAHGGNRTGRIFTGDRSGDWLFGSLYRTGWANQPHSEHIDDGLRLDGAYITAAVRCAPPANKPTTAERDNCHGYLVRELEILSGVRVIVALGSFAWNSCLRAARDIGAAVPRPRPRFGHLAEADLGRYRVVGSYHPSQQNTYTGKLTEEMLDAVFGRARWLMPPLGMGPGTATGTQPNTDDGASASISSVERRYGAPVAGAEKEVLAGFLDHYRATLLEICEGLTEEELRRKMVPSGTSLLGLVKHLAYVERGWFQESVAHEPFEYPFDTDDSEADFRIEEGESAADIFALYRDACVRSRQVLDAASLDDLVQNPDRRAGYNVRWVAVHMIEETARHAGHADILREQIDGKKGAGYTS